MKDRSCNECFYEDFMTHAFSVRVTNNFNRDVVVNSFQDVHCFLYKSNMFLSKADT